MSQYGYEVFVRNESYNNQYDDDYCLIGIIDCDNHYFLISQFRSFSVYGSSFAVIVIAVFADYVLNSFLYKKLLEEFIDAEIDRRLEEKEEEVR